MISKRRADMFGGVVALLAIAAGVHFVSHHGRIHKLADPVPVQIESASYKSSVVSAVEATNLGAGDIVLFGNREAGMRIWLDPDKLAAFNITAAAVAHAIYEQTTQVAGKLGYKHEEMHSYVDDEQMQEVIIKVDANGRIVRLKDVWIRMKAGTPSQP